MGRECVCALLGSVCEWRQSGDVYEWQEIRVSVKGVESVSGDRVWNGCE